MITREYTFSNDDFPIDTQIIFSILQHYPHIKNGVFFDIETTGFSAEKNALYLIGCCWFEDDQWKLVQWLANTPTNEEQTQIIQQFFNCISKFKTLISYNGHTFDLPFISKKCKILNLDYTISSWEHIDLFMVFRPLKSLLKLDNLKLKTIEKFLGIHREDIYSGGALIPIYESYTKTFSEQLLELLLLHNYEDIKDMLFVLPLYAYLNLAQGAFDIISTTLLSDTHTLHVEIQADIPLPEPVCHKYCFPSSAECTFEPLDLCVHLHDKMVSLNIPVFNGVLKHFYNNPKDYYYLPMEDYAIHKSVAEFVDKDSKKKATAYNCYVKKEGTYIPQKQGTYTPSFKFNYKDTFEWISYDDSMCNSKTFKNYIQSLLEILLLETFK